MHPPPAVGLEHGLVVRSAGHVPDVPDDLLVVPAGREFRFPGPACPVPVPATPAVPVEDVPGAFTARPPTVAGRPVGATYQRVPELVMTGSKGYFQSGLRRYSEKC